MIKQYQTLRFTWQSLIMWAGLTIFGYIFAGFFHMPGDSPPIPFNLRNLDLSAGLIGFLFGGVTGLVVAFLQWSVLKSWTSNARLWIPLNAIGFGLVHALGDAGFFIPLSTPLSLVVGGLIIGLAQSISLRHALSRVYLWVPVATVAWFLGFQLGYTWDKVFVNNPIGSLLVGYGTTGLITGIITGLALKRMVSDRTSQLRDQPDPVPVIPA